MTPEPQAGRRREAEGDQQEGGERRSPVAPQPAPGALRQARATRGDGQVREEALEVLGQLTGRGVARCGVAGQALQADGLEIPRQRGLEPPRRFRLRAQHFECRLQRAVAAKRWPSGEQGVEDRAQ